MAGWNFISIENSQENTCSSTQFIWLHLKIIPTVCLQVVRHSVFFSHFIYSQSLCLHSIYSLFTCLIHTQLVYTCNIHRDWLHWIDKHAVFTCNTGVSSLYVRPSLPQRGSPGSPHINPMDSVNHSCGGSGGRVRPGLWWGYGGCPSQTSGC